MRRFIPVWGAYTAAVFGSQMLPVVLALALIDRGGGPSALGFALGARSVGYVLAMLPAGLVADRRGPALVSRVGYVSLLLFGGLAVVAVNAGSATAFVLLAFVGAGEASIRPAYQLWMRQLVPDRKLASANALSTISMRVSLVIAPGFGALAATALGSSIALLISPALWVCAFVVSVLLPGGRAHPSLSPEPLGRQVAEGVAEARRHRWFVAGLGVFTLQLSTAYAAQQVLLPGISAVQGGSALLAASLTAYAIGSGLLALALPQIHMRNPGTVACIGLALYTLIPLSLAAGAWPPAVIVSYAVAGAGATLFNVPWFSAMQREMPTERLGTISSLDFTVSYAFAPVGLLLIGPIAELAGAVPVLLVCAAIALFAPLFALRTPGIAAFHEPALDARIPPTSEN